MYIVYYAPREENTWTVNSSCELTPEPKARVANTSCWLANFTPMGRILFFCSTTPESGNFFSRSGREVGAFWPEGRKHILHLNYIRYM